MNITPLLMALSLLAGTEQTQPMKMQTPPTAAEATQFVHEAEAKLAAINVEQQRASWVAQNFITGDTQIIAAAANEKQIALGVELAKQAAGFDKVPNLPYDTRRKLDLIKLALTTPGPGDPAATAEMARIGTEMEAMYGAGKYCAPGQSGDDCLDIEEITAIMQKDRDPKKLLDVWNGWHLVSRPMKPLYSRFVDLTNQGARELGYRDAGGSLSSMPILTR